MKYFSITELSTTSTGIANIPGAEEKRNLENLVAHLLDPIRERYGRPIRVNSGYRSAAVNKAIGGGKNSQHMTGEAADITGGNATENKRLFELIASSGLVFDQLIDEKNYRWIHVSLKRNGANRKQILHLP